MATVPKQFIVGRAADCDAVLTDSSVSGHHARLAWKHGRVLVEDLGSSNGTFVEGKRVRAAYVRPGDDVRLGRVALAWSSDALRPFLRGGAQGTVAVVPVSSTRRTTRFFVRAVTGLVIAGSVALLGALAFPEGREWVGEEGERVRARVGVLHPATSDEEAYIRARLATTAAAAIDPSDPLVRDTAVRLASQNQGPFNADQVAAIWGFVRARWRYVNDPSGREYFATAHETIQNNYAGDCDDFAIALAAMVGAIGGDARLIFMQDPAGGHAYTEVCVHEDASQLATELAAFYGRAWARYTTSGQPHHIAYRSSEACPVWLNLDWNATVPGGDYQPEQWAVAIYPDGHTETLAPASTAREQTASPGAVTGSSPRTAALPSR